MNGEVILSICAALTLIVAAVAVILAIRNRRNVTRVVRTLGVCVFLMLMTGIYPYYAGQPYALGLTLVESMCAMLLNASPSEILAGFDGFEVPYIEVYKSALLVILIIAPLFTVGITLSFSQTSSTGSYTVSVRNLRIPISFQPSTNAPFALRRILPAAIKSL